MWFFFKLICYFGESIMIEDIDEFEIVVVGVVIYSGRVVDIICC